MMQKLKKPVSILLVFMMIVSLFTVVPISASAEGGTIYNSGEHDASELNTGDYIVSGIESFRDETCEYTITLKAGTYTEWPSGDSARDEDYTIEMAGLFDIATDDENVLCFTDWMEGNYMPFVDDAIGNAFYVESADHDAKTITLSGANAPAAPTEAPTGYTVTFKNYDGTVLQETKGLAEGALISYDGETPVRPEDEENTYEFIGWDPAPELNVKHDAEYVAKFKAIPKPKYYTVTWKNHDGTVLETDTNVQEGTYPTYNGAMPTNGDLTFSGWSPAVAPVTGDVTYTAQFDANPKSGSFDGLNWSIDEDGVLTFSGSGAIPAEAFKFNPFIKKVIINDSVTKVGANAFADCTNLTELTFDSETPISFANGEYTYLTDTVTVNVPAGSTYQYTVQVSTIATEKTAYKDVLPTLQAEFKKEVAWGTNYEEALSIVIENYADWVLQQTGEYPIADEFEFVLEDEERTGNIADGQKYASVFGGANVHVMVPTYTVTWKNGETVLETDENVAQGTMPEYNGTTPVKDEDGDYIYTFKGWSPEVSAVTGDVTYTAVFDSFKKYVVIIKTPKGSSYNLTVTNNTTIAQIKADLADELGIPAAQQRLIFAGEELEDTKTLLDYNIQKEATIHDVPKSYTVTWLNDDGTTIDTTTVYYGDMPEYNGTTPEKDEDDDFTYTFSGWSPEVVAVTGDVEYTATFDAVAKYEAGYYVVGTMNNWAIDPAYNLAENPAVEGEYMLNDLALTASDEIKIIYAKPGEGKKWYPEGMGNNMNFSTDGSYNIYFRPDGQGGDDWYNGLIFAKRNPPAESAAVIDLINALPTDVTLADAEQIEAARNAYEALTDDQKSFIDAETLDKLAAAETALAAAEKAADDQAEADAVTDMIDALPSVVDLSNKEDVEAARNAYEALTDDQKALVTQETLNKLEAAETVIADREAAKAVMDQINALPAASEITLADKPLVDAAVAALDNLTFEQVEYVTLDTYAKLGDAEKAIKNLEAAQAVTDMINALGVVTLDDKADVEAARLAYDDLTDEQKALVPPETYNSLVYAETAIADLEAAQAVTDMINALPTVITLDDKADVEAARMAYDDLSFYQTSLVTPDTYLKLTNAEMVIADREAAKSVVDQINALPPVDELTLADKPAVEAANEARLNLTPAQAEYLTMIAIDKLFQAQDKIRDLEAAQAVTDMINALPTVITLDDKADVEAARLAYDDLSFYQTSLVTPDTYLKLTNAEMVIADREAAKAVVDQINALPPVDELTLADKPAVEAANEARLNLTPAQAEYLTMIAIDKLFQAQDKIRDLEAAQTVTDMINALPSVVDLSNKADVEAARAAYDALTDDQKALVDKDVLDKLTKAETVIADREAAKVVMDQINALPAASEITLADKPLVEAAVAALDNLTYEQAEYVTLDTYAKLRDAEKAIKNLEAAKAVTDRINTLPETITADNIETVDAVYSAYQALDENQKPLVDEKDVQKLNNAVLASFVVDAVSKLPENVTLDNWATVVTARGFYDGLDDAAKAFIGEDTLNKLAAAEKKIADLQAADDVIDQINALPETVTINDKEQIEAARAAYDALTDDQKALVDTDTLAKLTDAETALDNIVLLGDVDGDGDVTVTDATIIQRNVALMNELSEKQLKAADVDGDGDVSVVDATFIQRFLAGMPVSFPINEYA